LCVSATPTATDRQMLTRASFAEDPRGTALASDRPRAPACVHGHGHTATSLLAGLREGGRHIHGLAACVQENPGISGFRVENRLRLVAFLFEMFIGGSNGRPGTTL